VSGRPVAIDLDGALGDTRRLWEDWVDTAAPLLGFDPAALPEDRSEAAVWLDGLGAGNWRTLLERYAEERVPLYLRRDPETSSALRTLAEASRQIGVFTDAPEPLAQVALAHLGADRRIAALESGAGALENLVAALGPETIVVRSREDLLAVSHTPE
jgi:phosphoglycolate phosphatase-like HAD superfamily hydrolase